MPNQQQIQQVMQHCHRLANDLRILANQSPDGVTRDSLTEGAHHIEMCVRECEHSSQRVQQGWAGTFGTTTYGQQQFSPTVTATGYTGQQYGGYGTTGQQYGGGYGTPTVGQPQYGGYGTTGQQYGGYGTPTVGQPQYGGYGTTGQQYGGYGTTTAGQQYGGYGQTGTQGYGTTTTGYQSQR